jgi:hypothetical protein
MKARSGFIGRLWLRALYPKLPRRRDRKGRYAR